MRVSDCSSTLLFSQNRCSTETIGWMTATLKRARPVSRDAQSLTSVPEGEIIET